MKQIKSFLFYSNDLNTMKQQKHQERLASPLKRKQQIKFRKCTVALKRIDRKIKQLVEEQKMVRGNVGRPKKSLPAGVVKSEKDLVKYTLPLATERTSKRTPKPNRKYINESTITTLKQEDKLSTDTEQSDAEDGSNTTDEYEAPPSPSPTRKRQTIERAAPKTEPPKKVIRRVVNSEQQIPPTIFAKNRAISASMPKLNTTSSISAVGRALLNKRKIDYDGDDENSNKGQNKKRVNFKMMY